MYIRKVELSDSLDLLMWKNDSLSCEMSLKSRKVTATEHQNWLLNNLIHPQNQIYIGIINEQKIGVCYFNVNNHEKTAVVSINLNPNMRGKKLSLQLLAGCIEKFKTSNSYPLKAVINKKNLASLIIFKKCGFLISSELNKFYHLIKI
jgi:RimJ/RimL family protein N-acetyltransferase